MENNRTPSKSLFDNVHRRKGALPNEQQFYRKSFYRLMLAIQERGVNRRLTNGEDRPLEEDACSSLTSIVDCNKDIKPAINLIKRHTPPRNRLFRSYYVVSKRTRHPARINLAVWLIIRLSRDDYPRREQTESPVWVHRSRNRQTTTTTTTTTTRYTWAGLSFSLPAVKHGNVKYGDEWPVINETNRLLLLLV